ncbi:MAG TPA: septal ring lytic transglycosylase RlpA family protein [Caulobacteraceae bacterium]|nr:septal ring lytic transglycosylase RlpA family protein [Caulobacteraceae bacterium]
MRTPKGDNTAARRGGTLRLLAMAGLSGLGLTACASVTPEMAAQGARVSPPAAAPSQTAPAAGRTGPRASADGERVQGGGRYKVGAPYQVAGLWYVPAEQPAYDEVGVASWYGDEFNGQPTANGERFDMYSASAAHATLPMPSIVEVTNLENGKSMRVRLNDRGPFKNGRIIDLSRGAAQELGYFEKGTAKVRVRYIGPARLDGSLEPLFVARNGPADRLQPAAVAEAPPMVQATWRSQPGPAKVAPPTAPLAAGEGFAVQAGAFSDPAKARRIADALARAGTAAVRPLDMPDRTVYRVVVGPWRDAAQAQAARVQVVALGYADARVVKAF